MLVSHRKRFIYLKTAKTAGTSVEAYFEQYCLPENSWVFSHTREQYAGETGLIGFRGPHAEAIQRQWYNHMPAHLLKSRLGDDSVWSGYFKFCVVRNPFDKAVSAFHFWENGRSDVDQTQPIDRRFRRWVAAGETIVDRDKYVIDGQICVDYVIRYENLVDGIQSVCKALNLPFEHEKIPRLKSGIRPSGLTLSGYYDTQTIESIREIYAFEFEHFHYSLVP